MTAKKRKGGKYFSLMSNKFDKVYDSSIKTQKHLSKKINDKSYFSPCINLPSEILFNTSVNNYYEVSFHYPCRLAKENSVGVIKGIFLPKSSQYIPNYSAGYNSVNFSFSSKMKKVHLHKRKSNGKVYLSKKVFLTGKLPDKAFGIFKFKNLISYSYFNQNHEKRSISGELFILFFKTLNPDVYIKNKKEDVNKIVLKGLRSTWNINSIVKKTGLKKDNIWRRVFYMMENKKVSFEKISLFLIKNNSVTLRNRIFILITHIYSKEKVPLSRLKHLSVMEMHQRLNLEALYYPATEVQKKYSEIYGVKISLNLIMCFKKVLFKLKNYPHIKTRVQ